MQISFYLGKIFTKLFIFFPLKQLTSTFSQKRKA